MNNMMEGIKKMIEVAVTDYEKSIESEEMKSSFKENFTVNVGRKYIKIVNKGAWAFVVNTDDDHEFNRGDILKAKSWATPTRNAARGNVLEGDFSWIRWTGPDYLYENATRTERRSIVASSQRINGILNLTDT